MDQIIPVPALKDNYIWLLVNQTQKTAACVDPGDAEPVLRALQRLGLQLCAILITHHHYDHTHGITELLRHFSIPVYAPRNDPVQGATHLLNEDSEVCLDSVNARFQIIDIPAHTAGHIAYYGHDSLFCGDTLFTGGCGRLFEGSAGQMCDALNKLSALSEQTRVYCGHEYTETNLRFALTVEPDNHALKQRIQETRRLRSRKLPTVPSTLALEKATNPFLRSHEAAVKHAAENYIGHKLESSEEVFTVLRQWKDNF